MSGNHSLNILLVGGEAAGIQALRQLVAGPHHPVGVMAVPGRNPREGGLWTDAKKRQLDCIPADRIRLPEFAAEVERRNVDVLLNVHSLYLIPAAVLDACRIGAFNLHPGPLPEYAGLDVPSWAIYHGETTHGVTLHQMVPEVDAGYIAYQSRFEIGPSDNGLAVMSKCVRNGLPLIRSLLDDLFVDPSNVPQIAQDLSRRRYFRRKAPNNGQLSWNRPASRVVNHVRAADYSPFPSPWGHPVCSSDDCSIGVIRAVATDRTTDAAPGTVGSHTRQGVLVAARDFWVDVTIVETNGRKAKAQDILQRGTILTAAVHTDREIQPPLCLQSPAD